MDRARGLPQGRPQVDLRYPIDTPQVPRASLLSIVEAACQRRIPSPRAPPAPSPPELRIPPPLAPGRGYFAYFGLWLPRTVLERERTSACDLYEESY